MDVVAFAVEGYDRIGQLVHQACNGLDPAGFAYRPEPGANSIAWLVWHLTRVQDDHVSEIAGVAQAWIDDGWAGRFAMAAEPKLTGYGHGPDDVAALGRADPATIVGYFDAVAARTRGQLAGLDDAELDRIIDRSWDPPVSVGVRLVSVLSDNLQHAGQARYLRGIVDRLP